MSDEGRVMLAEAVRDIALAEVTPLPGKGALGRWRVSWVGIDRALPRILDGIPSRMPSRRYNRASKGRMRASA